eukprot:6196264-Pleurochrysis_carterae.AAC.1
MPRVLVCASWQRPWRKNRGMPDEAFKDECRGWDVNEIVFVPQNWEVGPPRTASPHSKGHVIDVLPSPAHELKRQTLTARCAVGTEAAILTFARVQAYAPMMRDDFTLFDEYQFSPAPAPFPVRRLSSISISGACKRLSASFERSLCEPHSILDALCCEDLKPATVNGLSTQCPVTCSWCCIHLEASTRANDPELGPSPLSFFCAPERS